MTTESIGCGSGPRKYLCNDCGRTFALKASLLRHKAFECNKGRQPYERQTQDDYERSKKTKKKHVCARCNRVYAFFTSLWRHQKTRTQGRISGFFAGHVAATNVPPVRTNVQNEAQPEDTHEVRVRRPEKLQVSRMPVKVYAKHQSTSSSSAATQHLSATKVLDLPSVASRGLVSEFSKRNRVFNCHQCGRSYQMRHNLVKHLRFECGGQKHFACLLCPSRYTQNGKLRQHMLNTHNIFVPPRKAWRSRYMSTRN
ncbi:zinc finger protein 569 [Lasius niger]|uniref:Zinc finger protein 569 n=1 Tax=Lasius niger TaxID=67767 RepID=A0A0J7L3Q1_LASNI|nr:zinc finger protein 569 [Lasius niger]